MKARLAALVSILVAACGDDTSPADGGGGAAGVGGGGAGGGAGGDATLEAADFVDPGQYDCRVSADPQPPPRPYRFGCVHDPECTDRFIAAHRMGTPFGPENSLSVLRASIVLGVDIAETDVRLTSDGHAVLLHDAEIDRTLEGTGDLRDLTLAELKAIPLRGKDGDPDGADFSCDRVPTIEEALEVGAGKIVIEFETKETEAAIVTAEYLRDQDLYASAYIQCAPDECDAVRAVVPDVPIMVRVEQMDHLDRAEAYDPLPILIEVDASEDWLAPEVLDRIHAMNAKAFTNAFTNADVAAILNQDASLYPVLFDKGLDVLQSEFPHFALMGIERAEPRDQTSP